MKKLAFVFMLLFGFLIMAVDATAATKAVSDKKKTYTEDEFISAFNGKMKKYLIEKLGQPARKTQSVRPAGASSILGSVPMKEDKSKPQNIEIWYYRNIVRYDAKNTYKEVEVTILNDRCSSVAFFNSR